MAAGKEPPNFSNLFSAERASHIVESAYARVETLAAIKDLRWFCTSWIGPALTPDEGENLYTTLYEAPSKDAPDGGLCDNALYIGYSTVTQARLYCVFPHVRRDIRSDNNLLEKWHDYVIRPAFEQAWRQTGWEGRKGMPHIPQSFASLKNEPIEEEWPSELMVGSDSPWDECLDLAWECMKERVDLDIELHELQDMFLVIVFPEFPVAGNTTQEAFEIASKHWECSVDPRHLRPDHFNVFFRTICCLESPRQRFWPVYDFFAAQ